MKPRQAQVPDVVAGWLRRSLPSQVLAGAILRRPLAIVLPGPLRRLRTQSKRFASFGAALVELGASAVVFVEPQRFRRQVRALFRWAVKAEEAVPPAACV